jgi:hypothetical protein
VPDEPHRDHLAEHLRERDREREPVRRGRSSRGRDLSGRNAFYTALADRAVPTVPARAPTPPGDADAVLAAAARECDADPAGVYSLLICALAVHCRQAVNPAAAFADVANLFRISARLAARESTRAAAATTGAPL